MGVAVAFESDTLRDGIGLSPLLPPGVISELDGSIAPRGNAGSFLIEPNPPGLMFKGNEPTSHLDYLKHPLYSRYMRLPKGLLAPTDASVLQEVHEGLSGESATRFLFASGWAAAEAAVVMRGVANNEKVRKQLVEGAANTWSRAYDRAAAIAEAGVEEDHHYSLKERIELALASVPLLEGIVTGDVNERILERVAAEYVRIGIENITFGQSKRELGDERRALFHEGLSCEILALLGLNEGLTPRRFAMPSTARNDSGYYLPRLTHDLMIFKQRGGQLKSMLPAEIKSHMTRQDRRRYKALIIDGGFMDVIRAGEPAPMIHLLARVYRGDGDRTDMVTADTLANNLWAIVAQYSSGDTLKIGNHQSVLRFHDASRVRLGGYAVLGAA